MASNTAARWQVFVPVKDPERAKTRLARTLGERRPELALAFARDTVAAAMAAAAVETVTVVTADERVAKVLGDDGAQVVDEGAVHDLNAVISTAVGRRPLRENTAVLLGDLPALASSELEHALALATRYDSAFVADAAGTGTTLLAARRGSIMHAHFGPGSAIAHVRAGATALGDPAFSTLRRDVDSAADLIEAARIGFGRYTAEALHGVDLAALG
jgi:2-phospho-L-lactate/phosphoenolpyruvate guanylyltransferase